MRPRTSPVLPRLGNSPEAEGEEHNLPEGRIPQAERLGQSEYTLEARMRELPRLLPPARRSLRRIVCRMGPQPHTFHSRLPR